MTALAIAVDFRDQLRNYLLLAKCWAASEDNFERVREMVREFGDWYDQNTYEVDHLTPRCNWHNQPPAVNKWYSPQLIYVEVDVWFKIEPDTRYRIEFAIRTHDVDILDFESRAPQKEDPTAAYERAMSIICTRNTTS